MVAQEARADLLRLNAFLVGHSPNAARRVMDAVDAALRSLADWPGRTPERADSLRELMISFGLSGYVVQFRIQTDTVVVVRVFHMRDDRSPD